MREDSLVYLDKEEKVDQKARLDSVVRLVQQDPQVKEEKEEELDFQAHLGPMEHLVNLDQRVQQERMVFPDCKEDQEKEVQVALLDHQVLQDLRDL